MTSHLLQNVGVVDINGQRRVSRGAEKSFVSLQHTFRGVREDDNYLLAKLDRSCQGLVGSVLICDDDLYGPWYLSAASLSFSESESSSYQI